MENTLHQKISLTYNDMWRHAVDKFNVGDNEVDHYIDDSKDTRKGLTLLSKMDGDVSANIKDFLVNTRLIEPAQYYYPNDDLHITMLSIISCIADFELSNIPLTDYINIVEKSLKSVGRFSIEFSGITASPSCIVIQGFPLNDQLAQLRETLRNEFKKTSLLTSIDARYKINTAHCSVLRFKVPIKNGLAFVKHLSTYRQHSFGCLEVKQLDLVFNDWYQRTEIRQELRQFQLL
jgi:2'-5' RNA ligase